DKRDIAVKMALERDVRLVRCEDGQLEIALEASAPKTLVHDLQRKLAGWTGKRWMVVVSKEQGAPTVRARAEASRRRSNAVCRTILWSRLFSAAFPAPRSSV